MKTSWTFPTECKPLTQKDAEDLTPLILDCVRQFDFSNMEGFSLEAFEMYAGTFKIIPEWKRFTDHLQANPGMWKRLKKK